MNVYYVFLGLTFLLSSQSSKSEPVPLDPPSSKVTVCTTEKCRSTADMLQENIDFSIPPCQDFYRFACGNFSNGHIAEQRLRRFYELNKKILEFLNSKNNSNVRALMKIQQIFRLCMNEDEIEKFGDKVIKLHLNNVGLPSVPPFDPYTNIPNNFGWILANIHRYAAIPFLFSLKVDKDMNDYKINRLYIQLDSFTITYSEEERHSHEYLDYENRSTYLKSYIMKVVKHLYWIEHINNSKELRRLISERVDEVVQFLLSADKSVNENVIPKYELITVQKLQEKTNKILRNSNIEFDWQEYLLTLFENMSDNVEDYFGSGALLGVRNMNYLESIFKIISTVDAEVFKASLWWVTVNDVINISYKELRVRKEKFIRNTFGYEKSRDTICLEFVKDRFSHALTHMLLQKENIKRIKSDISEMNYYIKNTFIENIEKALWMDESTRQEAIRKLKNIQTFISHESWVEKPDKIEEKYADITVKHSWYETRLKENVRRVEEMLKLLFKTNKKYKRYFPEDPLEINVTYIPSENIISIPFGTLGLPYFSHGLSAMDYGGIGFVLGHLFALAFNSIGRGIDSLGIKRNWWNEKTLQKFNKRAECFIDFYSNFNFDGEEIEIDGYLTLDSNIADNVGLKLALGAYEKYAQNYEEESKLIHFQMYDSEQLLTLAIASSMCWKVPEYYYDERTGKKLHSPYHHRVNGMFMNSQKMADIWNCPDRSPMNPKHKCPMW